MKKSHAVIGLILSTVLSTEETMTTRDYWEQISNLDTIRFTWNWWTCARL